MALKRAISDLPAATSIGENDLVPVASGGTVKKSTVAQLVDAVYGYLTSAVATATASAQDYATAASGSATTATTKASEASAAKDLAIAAWAASTAPTEQLSAVDTTFFPSTSLVTAVLYDTTKDYKQGAWRKKCKDKSWYNETIYGNQIGVGYYANEAAARAVSGATTNDYYYDTTAAKFYALNAGSGKTEIFRGGRREFPQRLIITVESARVVLWDLDFGAPRMWQVRSNTIGGWGHAMLGATSVVMKNGQLIIGHSDSSGSNYDGYRVVDFVADRWHWTWNGSGQYYNTDLASFVPRSGAAPWAYPNAVNFAINAVAITTLPNAPHDEYGRPKSTILVGTDGGATLLGWDGVQDNVAWDIVYTGYLLIDQVAFLPSGRIAFVSGTGIKAYWLVTAPIPTTDITISGYTSLPSGYQQYYGSGDTDQTLAIFPSDETLRTSAYRTNIKAGNNLVRGVDFSGREGLEIFRENPATPTKGMGAKITHTYNSGWLVGDIKRAWLADTTAGTITGGTQPDRCVKNKAITVVGSLTKSAVASGANLVAYSGFSTVNYLEEAYSSDLDFGTGDFCVMGWLNIADVHSSLANIFCRANPSTYGTGGISAYVTSADELGFVFYNVADVTTGVDVADGTWKFCVFSRASGTFTIFVNGVSVASTANSTNISISYPFVLGCTNSQTQALIQGSLALWRISATAPTAEQIKHIYETEKKLFEANAQCTLAGTSDAILAVDYDSDTDETHVATSYGRSTFNGLVRTSSEATPVGTPKAIASGRGCVIQVGSTGADVYMPAKPVREDGVIPDEQPRIQLFDFDAVTSQVTFTLPQGFKPVAVWSAGSKKREGATKDYTITFDGFLWSVVFGSAPGNTVWVQIQGELQ